jgi:hypothetical protein
MLTIAFVKVQNFALLAELIQSMELARPSPVSHNPGTGLLIQVRSEASPHDCITHYFSPMGTRLRRYSHRHKRDFSWMPLRYNLNYHIWSYQVPPVDRKICQSIATTKAINQTLTEYIPASYLNITTFTTQGPLTPFVVFV